MPRGRPKMTGQVQAPMAPVAQSEEANHRIEPWKGTKKFFLGIFDEFGMDSVGIPTIRGEVNVDRNSPEYGQRIRAGGPTACFAKCRQKVIEREEYAELSQEKHKGAFQSFYYDEFVALLDNLRNRAVRWRVAKDRIPEQEFDVRFDRSGGRVLSSREQDVGDGGVESIARYLWLIADDQTTREMIDGTQRPPSVEEMYFGGSVAPREAVAAGG